MMGIERVFPDLQLPSQETVDRIHHFKLDLDIDSFVWFQSKRFMSGEEMKNRDFEVVSRVSVHSIKRRTCYVCIDIQRFRVGISC